MSDGTASGGSRSTPDFTGRDRILTNVATSWVAQLATIVLGFVLPRFIDEQLGQVELGIWDLGWSLVSYLRFVPLGFASSLTRYVSLYRASGNLDDVVASVSSVYVWQTVISVVVVVFVWGMASQIGAWVTPETTSTTDLAAVIVLLGWAAAVKMAFDPSRTLLAAYHRWDINNVLNVASEIVVTICMIVCLVMGGGLEALAAVNLAVTIVFEVCRYVASRRFCPEAKIDLSRISWRVSTQMFVFGLKTLLSHLPYVFVHQSTRILLAASAGPAALAIYARSATLVAKAEGFVERFAMVLTPVASGMIGSGKTHELSNAFVRFSQSGVAITLPLALLFLFYGDHIILLWMGGDYVYKYLLQVVAIFSIGTPIRHTAMYFLAGANAHGRASAWCVVNSAAAFGVLYLYFEDLDPLNAALLANGSLTVGTAMTSVTMAIRKFAVSSVDYLREVLVKPIMITAGVWGGLLVVRGMNDWRMEFAVECIVLAFAGAATLYLYWRFLVTAELQRKILGALPAVRTG